jgi:UDP-glucose 4-epimerase
MNILITGGEGFVGRNLINYFKDTKNKIISPTYQNLDLRDTESVKDLFKKNSIDCIIHSAAVSPVNKSYSPSTCEDNLKIFFNLIKFKKYEAKMINLGSGSEYSREHWVHKMDEKYFGNFVPQDSFSFSKYLISKYIIDSKRKDLYHLRIFGIFGKYEDYKYKFISNTIAKKIFDIPITINRNVIYDYIFVEDFCRIVDFFIYNETENKVFNVTPTDSIDLISIIKIIDNLIGKKSTIKILKDGYGKEYTGENKLLLKSIPFFKFSNINDAIKILFQFYIEIKNTLDVDSLIEDNFLIYAKKINP